MPRKKGFFVRDFGSDSLGEKFVNIKYGKRGRLGKLLKITLGKRINLPRGVRITKIENNKPVVGAVKINYIKK